MVCDKCRSSNADTAKYCAVCGAPLAERLTVPNSYRDGFNGNARDGGQDAAFNRFAPQNYRPYPAYALPREPLQPKRSAGAIVFYILSGLLALACLALPLLPHIRMFGSGARTGSALEYAIKLIDSNSLLYSGSSGQLTGILILGMFILPMFFQLLWAIFSFVRIGAAGGMGLAGSIIYTNVGVYWILFLLNLVPIGGNRFAGGAGTGDWLTAAPYLVVALGVTGIIFSSIQLAQRRRVR